MDLRKTVIEILKGSSDFRIDEVTKLLKNGGVVTADDLKYFDWNSLKELGDLSKMEVNKIMRYIQENFVHEYEEHKRKRNEGRKLQHETEILKFKAEHEKKLQQQKIKFEEEKAARMKEQQEKEKEFRRSLQNLQNLPKKTNTVSQGSFTHMVNKVRANVMEKINSKCESKKGNVMTIEEVISEILKGCDETRIAEVVSLFSGIGATTADDLKKFNRSTLDSIDRLTDEERNKIMMFIGRNLKEEIAKILNISNPVRVEEISSVLQKDGLKVVDELRFYDWTSLETLGKFSNAEIRKIVEFVKEQFPESYEKHKRRRENEIKMMEELIKYKNTLEQLKADERMNFEEVISKIFTGYSTEARINKITEIIHEDGVKRAGELRYFDWKLLGDLGLTSAEITRIMEFVKQNFPKHFKIHERRRDEANRMQEELSKCRVEINELSKLDFPKDCKKQTKRGNIEAQTEEAILKRDDGLLKMKDSSKMSIEEAVTKIFRDSGPKAFNHVISAMKNRDIHMAVELKYYERDSLEDMGLIDEEINKIMAFVREKFSKIYKKHEITRDEVNIMYEQLSKHGAQINELFKLAKRSREKKIEDVETQEKQSSSQAEATELRQQKDEPSSSNSEDQTQTTNSIHLQEEPQKSSSHSGTVMLKRGIKTENYQTQEDCSNHQAGNPPNDSFKDSNINNSTSNDQPRESEGNQ